MILDISEVLDTYDSTNIPKKYKQRILLEYEKKDILPLGNSLDGLGWYYAK